MTQSHSTIACLTLSSPDLQAAVDLAADLFKIVSELGDVDRRVVSSFCVSTYYPLNPAPILVFRGRLGTGKSRKLDAMALLCSKPVRFPASKITLPYLREKLAAAHECTAIINEADNTKCDLETCLTLRYKRESAQAGIMVPVGNGWEMKDLPIFGPTVVAMRGPFADAAVESRCIVLRTHLKKDTAFDLAENWADAGKWFHDHLSTPPPLPDVPSSVPDVLPRVLDTYAPILRVAMGGGDQALIDALVERMKVDSESLEDSQAYEPGALLLEGILANSDEPGALKYSRGLPIEGRLIDWVFRNHRVQINPWQAAKLLRDLGFDVHRSQGVNCVFIRDASRLVKVCQEEGVDDEVLNTPKDKEM